jgi:hypothetical protein
LSLDSVPPHVSRKEVLSICIDYVHDRARAALSILKISEIEEILVPFLAKFAKAMIKPYYLER